MEACDDCSNGPVDISPNTFYFFGEQYSSLWVSSNNWIFLEYDYCCGWGFSGGSGQASIAPHGMDYSLKDAGTGYYRSMIRDSCTENQFLRVENLLNLFTGVTVVASWIFVFTFDDVPYWSDSGGLKNSWQCILVTSTTESYVIFDWDSMQRTNGASDGVGFHKGDGTSFQVPGIADYTTLDTMLGNTGCNGIRAFRVDTATPYELTPDVSAPPAVTPFLSTVTTFAVSQDAGDSSKLMVSFTPAPGSPPAAVVVETEYELTNRDQCEPITCPTTLGSTAIEHYPCLCSGSSATYPSEIPGLEPNSDYTVYVYAVDQCGDLVDSNTVLSGTATTVEAAPTAPPDSIMNTVVGCDDATFTWIDVPCGDRNGVITGYDYILYDSSGTQVDNGNVAIKTVTVTSLMPGTMYTFWVRAKTAAGDGPYNDPPLPFTTASATPPSGVTGLSLTPDSSDATQLLMSWTSPAHPFPSCPIPLGFIVTFELINRDQCEVIASPIQMTFITDTTDVAIVITGLEPYSTYTACVTPMLGSVNGPPECDMATTIEAVPIAPDGVTNSDLQCTSLIFNWNPIPCGDRHGDITVYNYFLHDVDGNLVDSGNIVVSDPTTFEIVDLMPGTTFVFSVAATNGAGTGPSSEALSVTTLSGNYYI
ncbi:tyrosine-protein phosphatase Lar-like [Amphiura filiformis]|uniref:tyrosine-protein phosphatase Lar-like n=1 Tax=Amphiura filiformis TaxID=82378 RepID=UPI003B20DA45